MSSRSPSRASTLAVAGIGEHDHRIDAGESHRVAGIEGDRSLYIKGSTTRAALNR